MCFKKARKIEYKFILKNCTHVFALRLQGNTSLQQSEYSDGVPACALALRELATHRRSLRSLLSSWGVCWCILERKSDIFKRSRDGAVHERMRSSRRIRPYQYAQMARRRRTGFCDTLPA